MAKSSQYWTDRFNTLQDAQMKQASNVAKDLEKAYARAMFKVQGDLMTWYQRFADNNEIGLSEAQLLLTNGELAEFKWTVEEYIKYGKENALDQSYMKLLENASARVHVRRLEAIKLQIQHQVEAIHAKRYKDLEALSTDIYTERYYRTAYETQMGFNIGWNTDRLDQDAINAIIRKPWAPDGKDFSSRIWQDRTKMINVLHTELTQAIIRGDGPKQVIATMAKTFDVSKNVAGRLVMTESAFFASAAQKDALKDLDVEKYKYVATLDLKTSDICQEMDGRVFGIEEYAINVTAPPLHAWCRSTTVPFFDDNYGERAARNDEGKTIYVPNSMTYKDWRSKFVGDENYETVRKMSDNRKLDKEQYGNYKAVFGKDRFSSFDEFQKVKYTKDSEWSELKKDYRALSHYSKIASSEPEITSDLKQISKVTDTELVGLDYRLKTADSYLRKIHSESTPGINLENLLSESKDIIRYTFQAESNILIDKFNNIENLLAEKGYKNIKTKNYWLDKEGSYKGLNVNYQTTDSIKFEIQYHTPESFELKNGVLHKLYEEFRLLEDKTSEKAMSLREKMAALTSELKEPIGIKDVK